jgi:hypothetical protein
VAYELQFKSLAMAKTNKIAHHVRELPALESVANRIVQSKPAGLYLLELRHRQAAKKSPLPKKELAIRVDAREGADAAPREIKIHHL